MEKRKTAWKKFFFRYFFLLYFGKAKFFVFFPSIFLLGIQHNFANFLKTRRRKLCIYYENINIFVFPLKLNNKKNYRRVRKKEEICNGKFKIASFLLHVFKLLLDSSLPTAYKITIFFEH